MLAVDGSGACDTVLASITSPSQCRAAQYFRTHSNLYGPSKLQCSLIRLNLITDINYGKRQGKLVTTVSHIGGALLVGP